VRLVVVYARSVYALYDSVRLYERSASLARHRPISEYRLRLESKGYYVYTGTARGKGKGRTVACVGSISRLKLCYFLLLGAY